MADEYMNKYFSNHQGNVKTNGKNKWKKTPTMRYHLTTVRIIIKIQKITNISKNVEKGGILLAYLITQRCFIYDSSIHTYIAL
jgi:hypothetical protein